MQAEAFWAYLVGYLRSVKVGERLVVLDEVVETRPPVELPWDDSPIRRFAATYQISVRR
jgi:cephalosporin hydroxylase